MLSEALKSGLHIMMTGSLPRRLHSYQTLAAYSEAVQSKPVDWSRSPSAEGACQWDPTGQ